jgi:hypothetical protein
LPPSRATQKAANVEGERALGEKGGKKKTLENVVSY